MKRIIELLGLFLIVPVASEVTYNVRRSCDKPVLDGDCNLICEVDGVDTNAERSIIVWFQERDIYEALKGRVEGKTRIPRIVASCLTENGVSDFQENAESVLPFPGYVVLRNCAQNDFRLGLSPVGMQHIGEWWCYYTVLNSTSPVKVYGDWNVEGNNEFPAKVVPADQNAVQVIRADGGKLGFYPEAPEATLPGNKVAGVIGSRATIDCPTDTSSLSPPITYTWTKVGTTKITNNKIIYANGSLTFTKLAATDKGKYECAASASGTTVKAVIELLTYEIPSLNLLVDTGAFWAANVLKRKDISVTVVTYAVKPGGQPEVVDSYTLNFNGGANFRKFRYALSLGKEYDGGKFYIVTYAYLQGVKPFPFIKRSKDWTIRVPYPFVSINLLPSPDNTHILAVEGRGVDIQCNAEGGGDPSPSLYFHRQLLNGQKIPLGANGIGVQWVLSENPKVVRGRTLETFTRKANGTSVECSSEGDGGNILLSSMLLEVHWLPDLLNFTVTPAKSILPAGEEVTFQCMSKGGYPDDVKISITHDGRTMEMVNQTLTVKDLSDANSGSYICTASNAAGSKSEEIYVAVRKAPLSLRDSIGPLILVIAVTVLIVGLIAAFFLYFKIRGDPDKRREKKKPKPPREPRFRPTKAEKESKRNSKRQTPVFTDITIEDEAPPLEENGVEHVKPTIVEPAQQEPMPREPIPDVDEITVEIPPSPRPKSTRNPEGHISEKNFDEFDFKFVDEDSDQGDAAESDEFTRL